MKFKNVLLLLNLFAIQICSAQNTATFKEINFGDNSYPIFAVKFSNDREKLMVLPSGGRVYMLDMGKNPENQTPNATVLWKNLNLTSFPYGGRVAFSANNKYVSIKQYYKYPTVISKQALHAKPQAAYVFNAQTGEVLFEDKNVYSISFVANTSQIMYATNNKIVCYNLETKQQVFEKTYDNIEGLTTSPDGKYIAITYDPSKTELKKIESVGANKKELKIANKYKRLVSIVLASNFKEISKLSEELDPIHHMFFSDDSKELYLMVINNNSTAPGVAGGSIGGLVNTLRYNQTELFSFRKINTLTGLLNPNFYIRSSEYAADFKISPSQNYYGYNQSGGMLAHKKRLLLFGNDNKPVGEHVTEGKYKNKSFFSSYFDFYNDEIVYLSQKNKLIEWNFNLNPAVTTNPDGQQTPSQQFEEQAITQIDSSVYSDKGKINKIIAKNNIKGLFLFNITMVKKGEVQTVFAQSDEKTNIVFQNILKDAIRSQKYELNIPKDTRVKFNYSIDIEEKDNQINP